MNFKTRNKLTIGLTGGILCGKSTALAAWKGAGAYVISCDELAREITARAGVSRRIAALFATQDRAEIARQTFSNETKRKQLEQLLHPLILREVKKRLQAAVQPVRVVEVPLLFEVGLQNAFDLTVCIAAPEKVRAKRLAARGMTKTDFVKRSRAQFSQAEKAALADICMINEGTKQALIQKTETLYQALSQIYTKH